MVAKIDRSQNIRQEQCPSSKSNDTAISNQEFDYEQDGVIIGIPAYNEGPRIGSTVLGAKQYGNEVIVVDDGSTDQTAKRAAQAGATVIYHENNKGKGGAIKTLLKLAQTKDFEAFVFIDGDGQHSPDDIPTVVMPIIQHEADLCIGSRYLDSTGDKTPLHRRVGQKVLDFLTGGSKPGLSDTQSGFRALSPAAVEKLSLKTDGIGIESEMIGVAKENQLDIVEKPIKTRYQNISGQTYHPLRHGLMVIYFILKLIRNKHPLIFFGLPGSILIVFGSFFGIDGILVYQNTGTFYPAKFLVSGFTIITGVICVFCGLILSQLANIIKEVQESDGE